MAFTFKLLLSMRNFIISIGVIILLANNVSAREITGPARTSCEASYSAPCSRVNSEFLATDVASKLTQELNKSGNTSSTDVFDRISQGEFNMEAGFYPFVFDRTSGRCVAHGRNPNLVGQTLDEIFDDMGIGFSLSSNLHWRFVQAADTGGDWVQYMWREDEYSDIVNKAAFVTGIQSQYYLGVGYATKQLPLDLPCEDKYDSWCSINNVRSLVGKAETRLNEALSLEQFEETLYQISFNADEYVVPGGHYLFMYRYDGPLKAHAILHRFAGKSLDHIFQELNRDPEAAIDLHNALRAAAEGQGDGWVQYPWKNKVDEPEYTKIAYVVNINFMGEDYYLGCGFNFIMGDIVPSTNTFAVEDNTQDDPSIIQETCPGFNLPCAFGSTRQLTSHVLSHCVSSPSLKNDIFDAITHDPQFRVGQFYSFMFHFNGTCVAHGGVPEFVGMNSTQIFEVVGLGSSLGLETHNRLRDASEQGGGYVLYDFAVRDVPNSSFQKISYIFRLSFEGEDYYGGVGFNFERATLLPDLDTGSKEDGTGIPCSAQYGSKCSEINSQAILGQAMADLILASSEAKSGEIFSHQTGTGIQDVFSSITGRNAMYQINDFHVAVFALDQSLCYSTEERQSMPRDDSGCCVAHGGNPSYVGKTWQEILDIQRITSIRGRDLHNRLIGQTDRGGKWMEYSWAESSGGAQTKIAFSSRFKDGDQSFYIMTEYFASPPPPTCDSCPDHMECTQTGQYFCEPAEDEETFRESTGFVILLIAALGAPCLGVVFFWIGKKREEAQAKAQLQQFDEQMQTMSKQMENDKKSASKANKLVASLFPEQVHDRIMKQIEEEEEEEFSTEDDDVENNGINAIVEKRWGRVTDGEADHKVMSTRAAICDLFPEATISFADIVGFTAWSSTREPSQVFCLLETIYQSFDKIAKRMKVFKVETIGDCYVAACGLPEKREDHAVVMVRFAAVCLRVFRTLVKKLELQLGPGTSELKIRWGLHSGPVTAGVLRGERGRFQLFGDTVNTAARLESTSVPDRIHLSQELVQLLLEAGKSHWVKTREDKVLAKGKGILNTYWLEAAAPDLVDKSVGAGSISFTDNTSVTGSELTHETHDLGVDSSPLPNAFLDPNQGLVEWNVNLVKGFLADIITHRLASGVQPASPEVMKRLENEYLLECSSIQEVKEIVCLPKYDAGVACTRSAKRELSDTVLTQLRSYIYELSSMYNNSNPFHNFHHATHVTMSVVKLMSRIVGSEAVHDNADTDRQADLHDHTYGITSDPLTQFAVILSALIHDVDHPAVPNAQLMKEKHTLASVYQRSIAELNSFDLAWQLLMEDCYKELRGAIYSNESEFRRFRQLMVNIVMATDIMDKELGALRKERWNKAFASSESDSKSMLMMELCDEENVNRRATIVLEHIIQASDVAHTMQHWNVYLKWNERFFFECYGSFQAGRANKDPSVDWYRGEMGFFDFYIIPLAKKLKDCGVFGVSSAEYLRYAESNRKQWEAQGQDIVAGYMEKIRSQSKEDNRCTIQGTGR